MDAGVVTLRVPTDAKQRAAAAGLLGGRILASNQTRRVELAHLTEKVRARGPALTPGAVAAHAMGRRLAAKAAAAATRSEAEQRLREVFKRASEEAAVEFSLTERWPALKRAGWIARLMSSADPATLILTAFRVIARLPGNGERIDRRRLASDVTADPHALDEGTSLGSLAVALLIASGRIPPRQRPRAAWAAVGVVCDDITGGLVAIGIAPRGWVVPPGSAITLPPRTLDASSWPLPSRPMEWLFVTENPSVAAAAADAAAAAPELRLLCTVGTPSHREVAAIAKLAAAGWRVAARADFDEAGLRHVRAILADVPNASPWRMSCADYEASLTTSSDAVPLAVGNVIDTPWDPPLAAAMRARGIAAYEETLLPHLLRDLVSGRLRS